MFFLKRTYEWFIKEQRAIGLISGSAVEKESDFLNPAQVRAKELEYQKEVE